MCAGDTGPEVCAGGFVLRTWLGMLPFFPATSALQVWPHTIDPGAVSWNAPEVGYHHIWSSNLEVFYTPPLSLEITGEVSKIATT